MNLPSARCSQQCSVAQAIVRVELSEVRGVLQGEVCSVQCHVQRSVCTPVRTQDTRQDNAVLLRPRCTGARGRTVRGRAQLLSPLTSARPQWPGLGWDCLALVSCFILSIYITFVVNIYFCGDAQ